LKNKKAEFDIKKIMSEFVIKRELFIKDNNTDIRSKYDIEPQQLGEGAFGTVYLGTEKDTGAKRAIKVILKEKIKNFQRFHNEVNALKMLDHPNIIKLFEVYKDDSQVYLVQELCSGGELFDFIVDKEFLTEDVAAKIFKQIMQAIMYCHKNRICHRDLKPENFMLKSKDGDIEVKLIDFGLSRSFMSFGNSGKEKLKRMTTKAGTLFFMAPEVLSMNYNNKCDIWSAGVILYIML
jgi:calcium-dependent protein kinase